MHFVDPGIFREQGAPAFTDSLWDLATVSKSLKGTEGANLLYGLKGSKTPLFSSADQNLHTNKCVGNLQFLKPIHPVVLQPHPDGSTVDVLAPQTKWVITHQAKAETCVDPTKNFLNVDLKVGGGGPASAEMQTSEEYAKAGPQFLGTFERGIGPNGEDVYCIKSKSVGVADIDFKGSMDSNAQRTVAIKALGRSAFRFWFCVVIKVSRFHRRNKCNTNHEFRIVSHV